MAYIVPPLTEAVGWTMMAVIFALLASACFLIMFFVVKERNDTVQTKEKLGTLEDFKLLFKNRFFYTICIMFLMQYINLSVFAGLGVYYCRDVLGDTSLYGDMNFSTKMVQIGTLFFVPFLASRWGKWKLLMLGFALMAGGMLIMYCAGTNITGFMIGAAVRGLGNAPISACLFTIVADAVEYGEWKNGKRQAGRTNSATSFGMKVCTGLGAAAVGWGEAIGDYNPALSAQTAYTQSVETACFFLLPVACYIVAFIAVYFTNIDKLYPTIIKDLAARRAAEAEN